MLFSGVANQRIKFCPFPTKTPVNAATRHVITSCLLSGQLEHTHNKLPLESMKTLNSIFTILRLIRDFFRLGEGGIAHY